MREILTIHIGQAGVQVGNACWELFCIEHGIQHDGTVIVNKNAEVADGGLKTLFTESAQGKFVPRSLFIDLEPTVIDQVRKGTYKQLFHSDNLISGQEDAANNFARGYYTIGKQQLGVYEDRIRKLVENCTGLQGIMVFNSIGGGTGSGLGSKLLEHIKTEYDKKCLIHFPIFPSPRLSTAVVEPYNALLAFTAMLNYTDASVVFDNEALYRVCQLRLGLESPNYTNINRVIAQVVSSMTSSIRFKGPVNIDLSEFKSHLIPYPRMHFLMSSYAPLMSVDKPVVNTIEEVTSSTFKANNMTVSHNPRNGVYMASSLMYRGDIPQAECSAAIGQLKSEKGINFVDWYPQSFKVGLSNQSPSVVPGGEIAKSSKSVCMIGNNTEIAKSFVKITKGSDLLYAKRSFVHWYRGEGMEEGEFSEARENLAAFLKDYEEVVVLRRPIEQEEEGEEEEAEKPKPIKKTKAPKAVRKVQPQKQYEEEEGEGESEFKVDKRAVNERRNDYDEEEEEGQQIQEQRLDNDDEEEGGEEEAQLIQKGGVDNENEEEEEEDRAIQQNQPAIAKKQQSYNPGIGNQALNIGAEHDDDDDEEEGGNQPKKNNEDEEEEEGDGGGNFQQQGQNEDEEEQS